jgi:hypothetical protein
MKKFWAILTCTFAAAVAAAAEGEILHTNLQARFKTLSFRAGDIRPLATVSISKSHVARLILDQLKGGAYDSSLSVSEVLSRINSFLSGLQADDAQASRIFLVQIGDDQPIDQIRSNPVWVSGWGDEIILTVETLYQFQKPLFVRLDLHELLTQAGISTPEMLSSAGTPKFMSHSRQGKPAALVWRDRASLEGASNFVPRSQTLVTATTTPGGDLRFNRSDGYNINALYSTKATENILQSIAAGVLSREGFEDLFGVGYKETEYEVHLSTNSLSRDTLLRMTWRGLSEARLFNSALTTGEMELTTNQSFTTAEYKVNVMQTIGDRRARSYAGRQQFYELDDTLEPITFSFGMETGYHWSPVRESNIPRLSGSDGFLLRPTASATLSLPAYGSLPAMRLTGRGYYLNGPLAKTDDANGRFSGNLSATFSMRSSGMDFSFRALVGDNLDNGAFTPLDRPTFSLRFSKGF